MSVGWYLWRLGCMSPTEVAARIREMAIKALWSRIRVRRGEDDPLCPTLVNIRGPVPLGVVPPIDDGRRQALILAADAVQAGRWPVFAHTRTDFAVPDWFLDPSTGIRAPGNIFAFRYPHRDPAKVGNLKYVWDASRHHHLTVLAAAWFFSREERYAERIAKDLNDWWRQNPFLTGPHWISGIELGQRLIAWTWCRRLLEGWPGAADLFERNPVFQKQLYRHQAYLHVLYSRNSSANNHLIAEAAGQFTAACGFPLFDRSQSWRRRAGMLLERELVRQTFPSGLNRELASEYHGYVFELGLVAALEGDASGHGLAPVAWERLRDMADVIAAICDGRGRLPRQGDGDNGTALLLDAPPHHGVGLLPLAEAFFDPQPWWPKSGEPKDVRTSIIGALDRSERRDNRLRPDRCALLGQDAGMVLLRAGSGDDEIWCRCDHGPHGYLGTAAHAHADALSIELRIGGEDVLADPGTYCYHTDPSWRSFFRSTFAHNTLELFGRDQSRSAGPFLWIRHAKSKLLKLEGVSEGSVAYWQAEHEGYKPVVHRRSLRLDRLQQILTIKDEIAGGTAPARLSFILGPRISCTLNGLIATLSWNGNDVQRNAIIVLPETFTWTLYRGSENPIAGWYSFSFSSKQPTVQLVGEALLEPGIESICCIHVLRREDAVPR